MLYFPGGLYVPILDLASLALFIGSSIFSSVLLYVGEHACLSVSADDCFDFLPDLLIFSTTKASYGETRRSLYLLQIRIVIQLIDNLSAQPAAHEVYIFSIVRNYRLTYLARPSSGLATRSSAEINGLILPLGSPL